MEDSKEKLLNAIRHYQDSLERHTKTGISEKLLHAIEKLSRLPIRVCHLEETGIGRTVNGLKKFEGKVGENARNLVDKWKSMVKGEDDMDQEQIGKKDKEKPPSEHIEENVENEVMDEDPDPDTLQICDANEQSDNEKPSYIETNYSSHKKSSNTNKDNFRSNDGHKNHNRRSRSRDKHDSKSKRHHSSEKSDDNSSDSDSDTNHHPKKAKYDRDSPNKSNKSGHKSRRHSSDSESQSESDSDGSESERESSSGRKKDKKTSRRNTSASSDRSSSSSDNSSENDSSSEEDSKKNKYGDRKGKKSHSSDSDESDSETESRDKYGKSKENTGKHKEDKESSRKHSKSNSESDRDSKHSKSRDSHRDSKDKYKSKDKSHDSKARHSKSKETNHEKNDKEKESSSRKDSSSSKDRKKTEDNESKHKKESRELEKSKSKSDSDRDSRKSKNDKYKESSGSSDSKKSSKSHKEKESSSKSPNDKRREREESSTDRESKRHKESNSDSKDSKNKSHRSSSSSKSKDIETSERKKESENKKDKKDRAEGDKSKRESSSSSSSKGTKDKDKEKSKTAASKPKTPPKQLPIIYGIDSESGASFADVLGMLEAPVYSKNKKKSSTVVTPEKTSGEKSFNSDRGEKVSKSIASTSAAGSSYSRESSEVPKLLKDPGELEPLDINMTNLLPSITPNYRPLSLPLDHQHKKMWTDDEALTRVINAKHQRTKVYSGNKTVYTKVPSLFDLCSRILQDNIDALEYTGGVPYSILKPIIEKANPDQLFQLEFHNPYLIEDSDELWLLHCQKEFRNKKREEMESWRDMYMRCLDEREAKLKALTANIKQSQDVKIPVRTTKLAYLDTVVKPPRNIAKKQARNGTAVDIKRPSQTPTERLNQLAKAGEAGKVAVPNPGKAATERSTSHSHISHLKPKKAPLMAKTLSLLKNRFGRR